jgi:hypothetical protein
MAAYLDGTVLPFGHPRTIPGTGWQRDVGDRAIMKMQPTLILSEMAVGAAVAAIALSPNASAQQSTSSCPVAGQVQSACQSPGNYQGNFSHSVDRPSPFEYPYGWLRTL